MQTEQEERSSIIINIVGRCMVLTQRLIIVGMLETLHKNLVKRCLLENGRPLLVGFSGGPDSLCLLDGLQRLGFTPVVAHFNHHLRPEADAEVETVCAIAQQMEVQFVTAEGDVQGYTKKNGLSIEEAARILRYNFLFAQARHFQAQAVLVAHNADDQVETVLMHLIRGCGLAGLRGMPFYALPNPWSQDIPLARPLLNVWRAEIGAYLDEHKLSAVQDASNADTRFLRNRLRHELIPQMATYNLNFKRNLLRLAEIVSAEDEILSGLVSQVWGEVMCEAGEGVISIRCKEFSALPPALRRRLLRQAIERLRPGLRDVDYETIELADTALREARSGSSWDLISGLSLSFEQDRCWLVASDADLPSVDWPQLAGETPKILEIPGRISLANEWVLSAEWLSGSQELTQVVQANTEPYQAWLNGKGITSLEVRGRKLGEHFHLSGLNGHSVKLSDLMVNVKLPRHVRQRWPLVCCGEEIAWVAGVRTSESFRISIDTRWVIHLQLSRKISSM